MASALSPAPGPISLSRRVVEWGILSLVILALVAVFLRQSRIVQAQAELAAIRTTLAALRVAATLDHIEKSLHSARVSVANLQRNPFGLLQQKPGNYLGELRVEQALAAPSSWFFEPACACVGYVPSDPQWLSSTNGAAVILFRVESNQGLPQLVALDSYRWQGALID